MMKDAAKHSEIVFVDEPAMPANTSQVLTNGFPHSLGAFDARCFGGGKSRADSKPERLILAHGRIHQAKH